MNAMLHIGSATRWLRLFLGFLVLLLATGFSGSRTNPTDTDKPNAGAPVLVELFTSEGCSSCPPADVMLEKLDTYQPIPGAQLIVLSEHVNYWDHDGWKDPNSSQALTDRQSSYESTLGEGTSFTPQIIVDGIQQIRLTETQERITDELQKAAADSKIAVRIGEVTIDGANPPSLHAHIETDENSGKHNGEVFVAAALNRVESEVLRGENGGKHLVHVAVVQELTRVGKLGKGKNFAQEVSVKLKPGTDTKNIRLVAFVQEPGLGRVLGAAVRKSGN